MENKQIEAYKFRVLNNRLTKPGVMPLLRIANEYCEIKIYYDGDYAKDFENNSIDEMRLLLISKTKSLMTKINIHPLGISLGTIGILLDSQEAVDKYIADLENIKQTTMELQNIFKEYFKIEYNFVTKQSREN